MLIEVKELGFQPNDSLFISYINLILDQEEDELLEDKNMLFERSYTEVKPSEVVEKQDHLLKMEQNKVCEALDLHPELFNGKLGQVPTSKI